MWLRWYVWVGTGVLVAIAAGRLPRKKAGAKQMHAGRGCARMFLFALSLIALAIGGFLGQWYNGRSEAVEQELFRGVRHLRLVLEKPRRVVANLIFVDLREKGVQFQVGATEPATRPKVNAASIGQYLKSAGVQVAINANFFHPFHSNSPWDFYPRTGDPVEVLGIAASDGDVYSTQVWAGATIYFSRENRVQVGGVLSNVWNAIAGDQWLVTGGTNVAKADTFGSYPRTAAGVNAAGDVLILAVVDGKQPGFSEGMTLPELGELLKSQGAHEAVNLDGGGSVTLVVAGADGKPVVVNSPIHTRIPGRQRPVGNQLGIRAEVRGITPR